MTSHHFACDLGAESGRVMLGTLADGNILIQAIALGRLPSLAAARDMVRRSTPLEIIEPQSTRPWDSAYRRLEKLVRGAGGVSLRKS